MRDQARELQGPSPALVTVDSFYTVSVIGKGSYAKVLLVKKKNDGQFYAMKVVKKQGFDRNKQEDHVRAERDILVAMGSCPFIIQLYYAFQTHHKLYFVLEYCPGGELFNFLQIKKRLSEDQACFYTAQMVLALEHLHSRDIIYRDLKPENVLIDSTGYIKLTDFGLSRMNVKTNSVKSICGTPEYLAPEVIMKTGYGKAADWWTLGCIIYEMLVGVPPFYAQERHELVEKIKLRKPKYPIYISPTAKSLIDHLLKKDPINRLGGKGGGFEVKKHAFFVGVDWGLLYQKKYTPFFIPKVKINNGLDNFDTEFTNMPVCSLEPAEDNANHLIRFEGFSWNNDGSHIEKIAEKQQSTMQLDEEFTDDSEMMLEENT